MSAASHHQSQSPAPSAAISRSSFSPSSVQALGPVLSELIGVWKGTGFNTIFRPDNSKTPTKFPTPPTDEDTLNTLMLSVTKEELTFGPKILENVPNRGLDVQPDINLSGMPYMQSISDITNGSAQEIHFETGIWVRVPGSSEPLQGETLVRMGSIPHGTTILAQGMAVPVDLPLKIDPISIIPITEDGKQQIPFRSLDPKITDSRRLPQVLPNSIAPEWLSNPNSLLMSHIAGQNIVKTELIRLDTDKHGSLLGGGNSNIDFLVGEKKATQKTASGVNADAFRMEFKLWIETVEVILTVPHGKAGDKISVTVESKVANLPSVTFQLHYRTNIHTSRSQKVRYTQLQYSQNVNLRFNGLIWPHVSVATLVPGKEIVVEVTDHAN